MPRPGPPAHVCKSRLSFALRAAGFRASVTGRSPRATIPTLGNPLHPAFSVTGRIPTRAGLFPHPVVCHHRRRFGTTIAHDSPDDRAHAPSPPRDHVPADGA